MNTITRRVTWAGLLALALLAAGCAPGVGDVSGKVTYKGQPLTGATITFYDSANHSLSDTIDAEGNYKVQKVAAGKARVVILTPMAIVFKGMEAKGMDVKGTQGSGGDQPGLDKPKTPKIPAKYSDPDKSGLSLEVKGGSQTKDFPLTD